MAGKATRDPVADCAPTDPARIRELMLDNLFAVFNERDPGRRAKAIARNYTEGRDLDRPRRDDPRA
jgi:hypothetical protein